MTVAVHVSMRPTATGARKLIFNSALAENTLRPFTNVTEDAPMAESASAARKPPWMTPAGLANRSSASMRHTVRPGSALSTQTMPSVKSQLGGTWMVGAPVCGETRRYSGEPRLGCPWCRTVERFLIGKALIGRRFTGVTAQPWRAPAASGGPARAPAGPQLPGRFERGPEKPSHVFQSLVERSSPQRIPTEERLYEGDVAEITQQRAVPRQHELLRIVTPEAPRRHLAFHEPHGPVDLWPQQGPQLHRQQAAALQCLPPDQANKLRVLAEKLEAGVQDPIDLGPAVGGVHRRGFDPAGPVHEE